MKIPVLEILNESKKNQLIEIDKKMPRLVQ